MLGCTARCCTQGKSSNSMGRYLGFHYLAETFEKSFEGGASALDGRPRDTGEGGVGVFAPAAVLCTTVVIILLATHTYVYMYVCI